MHGISLQEVLAKVQNTDKSEFDRKFREREAKERVLREANRRPGDLNASELLGKLAEEAGYVVEKPDKNKKQRDEAVSVQQQEKLDSKLSGRFPPPPRVSGT